MDQALEPWLEELRRRVLDITRDDGLGTNALYQGLYRCRRKLREILRQKGVLP